ncbi:MAG: hypothetical protein IKV93_01580 [Alphaproteobacteria bacterium]|nr:hypothetical protein [Alphaproteobacteria bacterium]
MKKLFTLLSVLLLSACTFYTEDTYEDYYYPNPYQTTYVYRNYWERSSEPDRIHYVIYDDRDHHDYDRKHRYDKKHDDHKKPSRHDKDDNKKPNKDDKPNNNKKPTTTNPTPAVKPISKPINTNKPSAPKRTISGPTASKKYGTINSGSRARVTKSSVTRR